MSKAEEAWQILVNSGYVKCWSDPGKTKSPEEDFVFSWSNFTKDYAVLIVENGATASATRMDNGDWLLHNYARERSKDKLEGHRAALDAVAALLTELLFNPAMERFVVFHEPNAKGTRALFEDFANQRPPGLVVENVEIYRRDVGLLLRPFPVPGLEIVPKLNGKEAWLNGELVAAAECNIGKPSENLYGLLDSCRIVQCSQTFPPAIRWELIVSAIDFYQSFLREEFLLIEKDRGYDWPYTLAGFNHLSTGVKWTGNRETIVAWLKHIGKVRP